MNWIVISPDIKYKLELIDMLLRSIECDFSDDSLLAERHLLAKQLTEHTINDLRKSYDSLKFKDFAHRLLGIAPEDMFQNKDRCEVLYQKYITALEELLKTINNFTPGVQDGRYFRYDFPEGHHGMLEFFNEKES